MYIFHNYSPPRRKKQETIIFDVMGGGILKKSENILLSCFSDFYSTKSKSYIQFPKITKPIQNWINYYKVI